MTVSEGAWVSLTHYPPGTRQAAHEHDFHQVSFLVAGTLRETLDGRQFDLHCASVGRKPAGVSHEDVWGPAGTLVFSINISPNAPGLVADLSHCGWARLSPSYPLAAIIAGCFRRGIAGAHPDVIEDALALLSCEAQPHSHPPSWLGQAHRMLSAEPDLPVSAVARAVKVDRSHLSRTFQLHYGMPPSVHRRRVLACRAVAAIARGEDALGRVAHEAGFSDQPHMNRVLLAEMGLVPSRLRRLLKDDLTSIQDAPLARR